MEYKALTQNTSIFTKTTTINTTTVLSDPLRYMFGTFRYNNSDGTKSKPYIFAPYTYQNNYTGSKPHIGYTNSDYIHDNSLDSCEVDGITYYGTKRASFYYPLRSPYSLKGIIKVIMYSSSEGTIVSNEYNVNLIYTSSSSYNLFLMIPKLSDDIILSITFEEETTETASE